MIGSIDAPLVLDAAGLSANGTASITCDAVEPLDVTETVPVLPVDFGVVLYMHAADSLAAAFSAFVKPVALNVPFRQSASPISSHAWSVTTVTAFTVMLATAVVVLFGVPVASMGVVVSQPVKARATQPISETVPDLVKVRFATFPSAQYTSRETWLRVFIWSVI
jgi:hypothetical protein